MAYEARSIDAKLEGGGSDTEWQISVILVTQLPIDSLLLEIKTNKQTNKKTVTVQGRNQVISAMDGQTSHHPKRADEYCVSLYVIPCGHNITYVFF